MCYNCTVMTYRERFLQVYGYEMIINGLVGGHAHGPYEYIEIHFMKKQANMHLGSIENHFTDRG